MERQAIDRNKINYKSVLDCLSDLSSIPTSKLAKLASRVFALLMSSVKQTKFVIVSGLRCDASDDE